MAELWALSQCPARAPLLLSAPAPLENLPALAKHPPSHPKALLKRPASLPGPLPSSRLAFIFSLCCLPIMLPIPLVRPFLGTKATHPPYSKWRTQLPPLLLPTSCLPPSLSSVPARGSAPVAGPRGGAGVPMCRSQQSPDGNPATNTSCTCQRVAQPRARPGSSRTEGGHKVASEGAPAPFNLGTRQGPQKLPGVTT